MAIEFSGMLSDTLHAISQALLIPVLAVLLIFLVYATINLGSLLAEYYHRRKRKFDFKNVADMVLSISDHGSPENIIKEIETCKLPFHHKEVLINVAKSGNLGPESREALARKMVENEEIKAAKKLEKSDLIAKIGPAIGLMGTLIPLGPGLAALGAGNIQELANHLIIAFDAAVLGMASAALGFTISKIRRRWYEEELSTLDTLAESILEVLKR